MNGKKEDVWQECFNLRHDNTYGRSGTAYMGTFPCMVGYTPKDPKPKVEVVPNLKSLKSEALIKDLIEQETENKRLCQRNMHFEKKEVQLMLGGLAKKVEAGLKAYHKDLDRRRDQLRALLLIEEKVYYEEMVAKAQNQQETEFKKRLEILKTFKAEEEREQKQIVEQKLEQKFRNCSIVREFCSKRNRQVVAQAVLQQIEDNKVIKQKEIEEARLWKEIRDKNLEIEDEIAKREKALREKIIIELKEDRKRQMFGKEVLKRESERLKQLEWEQLEASAKEAKERQRKALEEKKSQLKKEVLDNIRDAQERKKLEKEKEEKMEKTFIDLMDKTDLDPSLEKAMLTNFRAHQLTVYKAQSNCYKAKRRQIENEMNAKIQEEADKIYQKKLDREVNEKLRSQAVETEIKAYRQKQVARKRALEQREKECNENLGEFEGFILKQFDIDVEQRKREKFCTLVANVQDMRRQVEEKKAKIAEQKAADAEFVRREIEKNQLIEARLRHTSYECDRYHKLTPYVEK